MNSLHGHKHTGSVPQNQKAQLANAYNELGKELSSTKVRVVGNYTLGRAIGEGAFGKVRMGTHRLTSTRVAIKQIPKSMSASLTREIHHHRQLHHPHIAQMYEVIATEASIWIVTELCSGGELFDYLVEKGRLTEDETRIIFGQLCLAVGYLHDRGIVHRDLKLENILLDEHCRVKIGDFGFTREFERGMLMETFCGTTGYASPEMLQGRKYQGPEIDVWSLGVILYTLLTGMLPFDDDDELVMKDKIILGEFEDPDWLSSECRDLIKGILQKDTATRLTLSQILSHPWFKVTHKPPVYDSPVILKDENANPLDHSTSGPGAIDNIQSSESSHSAPSESIFPSIATSSTPTTPDEITSDPFLDVTHDTLRHRNASEVTLKKLTGQHHTLNSLPSTIGEAETEDELAENLTSHPLILQRSSSSGSRAPPMSSVRTPARTKRRSVTSVLSDSDSPTAEVTPSPLPQASQEVDFSSLLSTPAPIIFSTPLERHLLNTLSLLGMDTGQVVYSVLNDACDSASAVWWMLVRKAEKRSAEDPTSMVFPASATDATFDTSTSKDSKLALSSTKPSHEKRRHNAGVQTDPSSSFHLNLARSAPQLAFVPPTPTGPRPVTPPRSSSPSRSPMLSPSASTVKAQSNPGTPSGSTGSKGRKTRSGSVSIMQRATTALEAAGLVRKKSSEQLEREREREREKSKEMDRRSALSDEPRLSHGSSSSKLTKSPPLKASKGPSTPPPSELHHVPPAHMGSPWVLAESGESLSQHGHSAPTPNNSPGEIFDLSNSIGSGQSTIRAKPIGTQRNRANILTAFRHWFNDDRKGKRKENVNVPSPNTSRFVQTRNVSGGSSYSTGSVKRRGSGNGRYNSRVGGHRGHRPSVSSRRSSSVNSRRSSITSVQMIILDSPQVAGRRSFGSHTPNSEQHPSRPSSVHSFSMQKHRKSPSASSSNSAQFRTASPMQKYHRRAGSGSSTRVVRHVQRHRTNSSSHHRSNSAASSIHSPVSSRPTSYIEYSEGEMQRSTSPRRSSRGKRSTDDGTPRRTGNATFVAQKRQPPFSSPGGYGSSTIGRSSWKKSWGREPPGWRTRTAQLPVEVLAVSAGEGTSLRDVFSGRQSLNLGDESDWVDEEDDSIPYATGLGQGPTLPTSSAPHHPESPVVLSPPPRGYRSKHNKGASSQGNSIQTKKAGHSPGERSSPVANENFYDMTETRGGRRQLQGGRSGPAFKQPIQEEDEDEEE